MAFVSLVLAWINWGSALSARRSLFESWPKNRRGSITACWCDGLPGPGTMCIPAFPPPLPSWWPLRSISLKNNWGHSHYRNHLPPLQSVVGPGDFNRLGDHGPFMHPKKGTRSRPTRPPQRIRVRRAAQAPNPGLDSGAALEKSPIINLIVGICGLIWLGWHFGQRGFAGINLDVVNFAFLMVGVLLHWTPTSFLKAAQEGDPSSGGGGSVPLLRRNFRDHPIFRLGKSWPTGLPPLPRRKPIPLSWSGIRAS